MIRDITIGQYYSTDSSVHSLDPRTKLAITLLFIVSLFIVRNPVLYVANLVFIIVAYYYSKISIRYMIKGLRTIIVLLVFTLLFHSFIGETPFLAIGSLTMKVEGVHKGIKLASRIALMIMGASLLSYTTTPKEMADGLEKSLSFLEKFHIPIHDLALMVTIAFRFIPTMMEEINFLIDAQTARGADFEKGNIFTKMKRIMSLLVPLFISTVRRSADLAMAMESRGYRNSLVITKLNPLEYSKLDIIVYIVSIIYIISLFVIEMFLI